MSKKCVLCSEKIQEECGKLKGTIVRVKSLKNKNYFIFVCSDCQKNEKGNWLEKAKVRGV